MTLVWVLLLMMVVLGGGGRAAEIEGHSAAGKVRLLVATSATGTGSNLTVGVQFLMAPGWKIYWRTPGDAGYPPRMDWSGSRNIGVPTVFWPAPKRFTLSGLQNHGYEKEVVLPVALPVLSPGEPVHLSLAVDYLACAETCVPMAVALAADVPAGLGTPTEGAKEISRFMALVPGDGTSDGLALEKAEVWTITEGASPPGISVLVRSKTPLVAPDVFVESAEEIASFDAPRRVESLDGIFTRIDIPVVPGTLQGELVGSPLTITVTDGARSMEVSGVRPSLMPVQSSPLRLSSWLALVSMLGVAFVGGLILNVMPCVLPVLSIKVLGVLGHGGGDRQQVRTAFLASAAGILVSFLALALVAIAFKAAGQAVGWGLQFQNPVFLAVMILLLLLFALNLWGVFEIRLPSGLLLAGGNGKPHTFVGHFLSGAFATLLATPCSAPFLGTAVGFALAQGAPEILAIFSMLGMGMALPFLVLATWPGMAQCLPKPGRWMLWVKKAMAVALLGTALWLGSILSGPWSNSAKSDSGAVPWVPFNLQEIDRLVQQKNVVFVDVTADWCITCKVNKLAVVEQGEVAAHLTQPGIVAMKADWTKPDEAITQYLKGFGKYGIPFNVVYGPGAPQGIVLSEVLTTAGVLEALRLAKGIRP